VEFARAGIPAAFTFSGYQYVGRSQDYGDQKCSAYSSTDYHQVSDEVRTDWDYSGVAKDAEWRIHATLKG